MGKLTTHVLDTAHGRPASAMGVALYRVDKGVAALLMKLVLDDDGRADAPLLEGPAFAPGTYRLVFSAGAYFRKMGTPMASPPFLDEVPIDFGLADATQHYHVPLLVSPWAYSTYRGS